MAKNKNISKNISFYLFNNNLKTANRNSEVYRTFKYIINKDKIKKYMEENNNG